MTTVSDDVIDCMARMKGEEQPFAVATVVRVQGAAAAKAGAKAVVRGDGELVGFIGGGCATGAVRKAGLKALADGQARLIRVLPGDVMTGEEGVENFRSVCPSGGTMEIFIEPVLPRPALLIAGASPVARALCDLASRIGYAVTVAAMPDDLDGFESAHQRIEGFDLEQAIRGDTRFVVVATQGKRDREALKAALESQAPYVAFIGSRRKAAVLAAAMRDAGIDEIRLKALRAPAGLHLGAVTPEEIALSVLAEVTCVRRQGGQAATLADADASAAVGNQADSMPEGCCKGH